MGYFNSWTALGGADVAETDDTGAKITVASLLGVSENGGKDKLVPSNCSVPSIPVDDGQEVTLRDGSLLYPIKLSGIQLTESNSPPNLLTIQPDGTIQQWASDESSINRKFVIDSQGIITLKADAGSSAVVKSDMDALTPSDAAVLYTLFATEGTDGDGNPIVQLGYVTKAAAAAYFADTITKSETLLAVSPGDLFVNYDYDAAGLTTNDIKRAVISLEWTDTVTAPNLVRNISYMTYDGTDVKFYFDAAVDGGDTEYQIRIVRFD